MWLQVYSAFIVCVVLAVVASIEQTEAYSSAAASNGSLWKNVWQGNDIDCTRTNWVHTAKTSSTLCFSLQHVCCPTEWKNLTAGVTYADLKVAMATPRSRAQSDYTFVAHYCYKFNRKGYEPMNCQIAGRPEHIPLHPQINLQEKMGIIIVREPKSRLISSFLDGVHMEGFTNRSAAYELRGLFHQMDLDKTLGHQEKLLKQAQMYANQNVLHGHQVKMLLGGFNMDLSVRNETIMVQLVDRAVQRLREFFFVGVFEEYTRSLNLLHALANKGKPCNVGGNRKRHRKLYAYI